MNIYLNGEPQQVPDNITAAQLLETLGLTGKRLAMEVNMEIVPRSTFEEFVIHSDDRVEIVHAIGGG
ncbi:MAG: thiamine biosynthesis protein ThiS [Gammaproteobacteria bacterium SG8_11]|nr:MAG: thiamine biosynthesis protein ThiS [Gammaproteobacteria bacterium SG8_11]